MKTKTVDVRTIRFYVPDAAAETPACGRHKTVMDVLKHRAADYFGGYTVIQNAAGGWLDGRETVDESVTILEVVASTEKNLSPEQFTKVNARYIKRVTDENQVMAVVGNTKITVK